MDCKRNTESAIPIVLYKGEGTVEKFCVGRYNDYDLSDLEQIATIIAQDNGVTIQILPKLNRNDPNYEKIYFGLIGTTYEGKCPDLKVITIEGKQEYLEFESYSRPFSAKKLSRMITNGSKQSDKIIIDIRDTNITGGYVRRQVFNRKHDKSFNREIKEIWTYNGPDLKKEWG